ncbi:MAG: hypothetical protein DDT39_01675 [Firmicutes bacterium]|nr:hypothetical protein [candidate division NPL-UPA2 bacterium]
MEFRRAYWAAAARQAEMVSWFDSARLPRDLLVGISAAEREVLVRTLVAGLRELPPMWSDSEAFRTIIIDLDPPLLLHGVPMSLDTELSGTPAGKALARMRAHAEETRARWEWQRAYESPQAVEERKRVNREMRAIAHVRRQSETRRRNTERLQLLAALARVSPGERLSRFATDPALKLDGVSAELIPTQERDLIDLETGKAVALLARIGRRKGAWGCLRRMLERHLRDDSEA